MFWIKAVCQTAPAHIPGQNLLFLCCGRAVLCRQFMQQVDGGYVVGIPFAGGANTQQVICDAVVDAACIERSGSIQPLFLSRTGQ